MLQLVLLLPSISQCNYLSQFNLKDTKIGVKPTWIQVGSLQRSQIDDEKEARSPVRVVFNNQFFKKIEVEYMMQLMIITYEANMLRSEQNRFNTSKCGCHHNETHVSYYFAISPSQEHDDEQWQAQQEGAPLQAKPVYPTCCITLCLYLYIYMYILISLHHSCICIYIYINIYREREVCRGYAYTIYVYNRIYNSYQDQV